MSYYLVTLTVESTIQRVIEAQDEQQARRIALSEDERTVSGVTGIQNVVPFLLSPDEVVE